MPPLEDDIKDNLDLLGVIVAAIVGVFVTLKSAVFKNKKIDVDNVALDSYKNVFDTINNQVEHITTQYDELLEKYNVLLKRCQAQDEIIHELEQRLAASEQEAKEFREKTFGQMDEIERLLHERGELITRNISLANDNLSLKRQAVKQRPTQ